MPYSLASSYGSNRTKAVRSSSARTSNASCFANVLNPRFIELLLTLRLEPARRHLDQVFEVLRILLPQVLTGSQQRCKLRYEVWLVFRRLCIRRQEDIGRLAEPAHQRGKGLHVWVLPVRQPGHRRGTDPYLGCKLPPRQLVRFTLSIQGREQSLRVKPSLWHTCSPSPSVRHQPHCLTAA